MFIVQAGEFIKSIGLIVQQLAYSHIGTFFVEVMTVFFTLSILGKLRYRENGGEYGTCTL